MTTENNQNVIEHVNGNPKTENHNPNNGPLLAEGSVIAEYRSIEDHQDCAGWMGSVTTISSLGFPTSINAQK